MHKMTIEEIQREKEDIKYSRYLGEIKVLNMAKEYLSMNRKQLSRPQKEKVIQMILDKQEALKQFKFE